MWSEKAFQVLLFSYNAKKHIKKCLQSLDHSLKNEKWILLIGDDSSTDNTIAEIMEYIPQSSADKVHVFEYGKSLTIGEAKNRLIKEAHCFKKEYPAVLMIDGDDEMTPERPRMIETAIETKSLYVVGGWESVKDNDVPEFYGWKGQSGQSALSAASDLQFGSWATLFHVDFLPANGKFFPEDEVNNCGHEDLLTWSCLKFFDKCAPTPHKSKKPVHLYHIHLGGACNTLSKDKLLFQRDTYWALLKVIKNERRNIVDNPLTLAERNRAIAKYIMREKYKANRDIDPLL